MFQQYSNELTEFVTVLKTTYYYSPLVSPDAIDEIEQFEFTVLPNPSAGVFQCVLPETIGDNARIIVSSLNGNIIYDQKAVHGDLTIDLTNYTNVIYLVQIISSNKLGVKKLLKF